MWIDVFQVYAFDDTSIQVIEFCDGNQFDMIHDWKFGNPEISRVKWTKLMIYIC